jgi:nitroreductase
MDTITAIHPRRSIRNYEQRAVEREIIADILWDAAQAPTTPVSGPQSVQDCNRAGQNLMLSAHTRGLGSYWVGAPMLWLRSPETRKELGIVGAFAPFAAFTLGYVASLPPSHSRERPQIVWA